MYPLMAATVEGDVLHVPIETYPDMMPRFEAEMVPRNVCRLLLRPTSLFSFMSAMFLVDAMTARGQPVPELILPCMPGSRQDRLNRTGDFLFTARSVAGEINWRGFPKVTLVDPHSDVTPALVNRSVVVTAADCINPPRNKYDAVISPDAGAEKRASAVAKKLGVPLIHAWKTRDVATGNISGFGMEQDSIHDGLALVVDDLCDAGGTFLGLGEVLRARAIGAHLWVTHGLFHKGTKALLERYGHLYCTDSVAGDRAGVIEINVCERLLKGETL